MVVLLDNLIKLSTDEPNYAQPQGTSARAFKLRRVDLSFVFYFYFICIFIFLFCYKMYLMFTHLSRCYFSLFMMHCTYLWHTHILLPLHCRLLSFAQMVNTLGSSSCHYLFRMWQKQLLTKFDQQVLFTHLFYISLKISGTSSTKRTKNKVEKQQTAALQVRKPNEIKI